jgi:uncharacterized membrane protein YphA (DoxX/SURF4 family)
MKTMSATQFPVHGDALSGVLDRVRVDPAYQAYWLLRIGFTVAPILFGLDKFAGVLVDWTQYLAPWIARSVPVDATTFMHVVGGVEIVAGLVVAFAPRFGGYLVAAWLAGIIVDLVTYPGVLRRCAPGLRSADRRARAGAARGGV